MRGGEINLEDWDLDTKSTVNPFQSCDANFHQTFKVFADSLHATSPACGYRVQPLTSLDGHSAGPLLPSKLLGLSSGCSAIPFHGASPSGTKGPVSEMCMIRAQAESLAVQNLTLPCPPRSRAGCLSPLLNYETLFLTFSENNPTSLLWRKNQVYVNIFLTVLKMWRCFG